MEAAVNRARVHKRAAAVFICSASRPGNSFFTALVPGEEEEACIRSTFYFSLLEARRAAKEVNMKDYLGAHPHIPDDGAVLCKNVLVLRDAADTGYAPYPDPIEVPAVLAISMPQKQIDKGTAQILFRKKIGTILQNIKELEVDCLIIPESGADYATKMWTRELGAALAVAAHSIDKELLPKEVVLSGSMEFFEVISALDTNTGW